MNSHTFFSCSTALSMGLEELVIRSCLSGNAQLPESSGIHAKQFWILDFGFWI